MSLMFAGASKKKDAERALKKRPVLVLFFMDGCPHCENNKKAWNEAKQKCGMPTVEIESSAVPDSQTDVNGFPTMMVMKKDGTKKSISGERQSGGEILSELGVKPVSGGRNHRFRTFRRFDSRRNRKFRNRTLRNYIPLRK
jgi:hypothetical protein